MDPDVRLTVDRERVVLTNSGTRVVVTLAVGSEPVMALPPGASYIISTDWETT